MKTISNSIYKSILVVMAALFILIGAANNLWAHDGEWDSNHHYYRPFILYHDHHGYWDTRGAVRVFINVD